MNDIILKGIINKDSINNQDRIFQSWGSVEMIDRQGDLLPIDEFRPVIEKLNALGHRVPLNDSHSNHGCGEIIKFEFLNTQDGKKGLLLTGRVYSRYDSDTDIWEAIKDGRYTGLSLGGKAGEKIPICDQNGCYNLLKNPEIWEFSLVETPANPGALFTQINKLAKGIKIHKARVYVKYPADAPQGSHIYTGDKGGKYYETEEIGNKGKREQIEREQKAPKMNVKSLQDVIGNDSYTHMNTFKEGRELKDLLETYGKISSGTATDQDIDRNFQFIRTNLPKIHQMYYFEGREDEVLAPDNVYSLKHRKIAENIKKLMNEFDQAKDRKDKTIAIDNFVGTAHTSGLDIISTLWLELWDTGREVSFIERTAQQYMDHLRNASSTESAKNPPQIKVKSLQDVIGTEAYTRMDKWREGRELKDLLNVYTKISTGTATDEEVNRSFDFIEKRLPEVYNFYAWAARDPTDKDTVIRSPEFRAEHKQVADNVKKVQNIFAQARDRKDRVIAIDNFMNTSHTSGDNIVARLWNAWKSKDEEHDRDFVWISDIPDKYMDYLHTNIGKALIKAIPIQKYVHKCDDKFCVYSEAGKKLGSHETKEDANKQLQAIEINKKFFSLAGLNEYLDAVKKLPGTKQKMGNPVTRASYEDHSVKAGRWLTMDEFEEIIGKSDIQKARVYVKNPSEAPSGLQIHVGPEGGKYYESGRQEPIQETNFTTRESIKPRETIDVTTDEFEAVKSAVPENLRPFLSSYTPAEMKEMGVKTFLTKNKRGGAALKGDEIINVFSLEKGEGKKALLEAIARGGRRLDCFDKLPGQSHGLPEYYSKFGFKEVRREKNWTPGGPDVIYMSL